MPQWITAAEALENNPDFFTQRGENSWQLDAENRRIYSRFGFAEVRVQTRNDGTPDFDRVVYGEAPSINAVVWGREKDGQVKVALVTQTRPFADNPDGTPAVDPIKFGQPCVMGFLDKLLGKNLGNAFEEFGDAAVREAAEEAGAMGVISVTSMENHNPLPTCFATWTALLDIEVDLAKVTANVDSSELIHKAEYLPLWMILMRIAESTHEGINYRAGTPNDALFVWLTKHPFYALQAFQVLANLEK